MKFFLGIVFMAGISCTAKSDTISDFYRKLNDPEFSGVQGSVKALDATAKVVDWSMGAGLGPTDQDYLRFLTVTARLDDIENGDVSSATEIWSKNIIAASKIKSDDISKIRKLITNDDASVRYIGLMKIKSHESGDVSDYKKELLDIASRDGMIYISRYSMGANGEASPLREVTHRFKAPLRELALSILYGDISNMDYESVSSDGIRRLINLAASKPSASESIKYAIMQLEPSVPSIKNAQDNIESLIEFDK